MQGKGLPLVFRAWKPGDTLTAGVWGIQEPLPSSPAVDPDVLLVPLLAFDTRGYRLGYGGGFYDRTLAGFRTRKRVVAVGVAFDEQRIDAVPTPTYDRAPRLGAHPVRSDFIREVADLQVRRARQA